MNYNEYIQNIIDTRGQWGISKDEYFEMHHITPSCIGGTGDYITPKGRSTFYKNSEHYNCIYTLMNIMKHISY